MGTHSNQVDFHLVHSVEVVLDASLEVEEQTSDVKLVLAQAVVPAGVLGQRLGRDLFSEVSRT